MSDLLDAAKRLVELGEQIKSMQKDRIPGPYDPAITAFLSLRGVEIQVRLMAKEGCPPDVDDQKLLQSMMGVMSIGIMKEGQDIASDYIKVRGQLEKAIEALEITNDCLFGNTYGDSALDEAYQVVHSALAKIGGTQDE